MDQYVIALQAEMYAILAELKGMEAENQFRIQNGDSVAYGEEAYQEKANYLWELSGLLRQLEMH